MAVRPGRHDRARRNRRTLKGQSLAVPGGVRVDQKTPVAVTMPRSTAASTRLGLASAVMVKSWPSRLTTRQRHPRRWVSAAASGSVCPRSVRVSKLPAAGLLGVDSPPVGRVSLVGHHTARLGRAILTGCVTEWPAPHPQTIGAASEIHHRLLCGTDQVSHDPYGPFQSCRTHTSVGHPQRTVRALWSTHFLGIRRAFPARGETALHRGCELRLVR